MLIGFTPVTFATGEIPFGGVLGDVYDRMNGAAHLRPLQLDGMWGLEAKGFEPSTFALRTRRSPN